MSNPWLTHCPSPRSHRPEHLQYDVFLSYRSVNRRWTFALYDTLVDAGFEVFIDQVELKPGDSLREQLQTKLEQSASGVLIWSEAAADSEWVKREHRAMEVLRDERKDSEHPFHFVIAKLDDAELPLFARDSLYTDFSPYPHGPTGGELLRLMVGLVGEGLGPDRARLVLEVDEETKALVAKIKAARANGDRDWLLELSKEDSLPLTATPALLGEIAESFIALKDDEAALEVCREAQQRFPSAVRPRQLEGLAHRRLGRLTEAQRVLGQLYAEGHRDPETMGIYAASFAKRYDAEGDINLLRKSQSLYEEAFRFDPNDSYVGVNAASKAALLGESDKARELANQVIELPAVATPAPDEDYWAKATRAEVKLLQGDIDQAVAGYRAAVDACPEEKGSHGSTLDQLEKLIVALGIGEPDASRLRAPLA